MRLDGKVTIDRLRDVIQDANLTLLVGAGTPSSYFGLLQDVELTLTQIDASSAPNREKLLARASVYAYFFRTVIEPNVPLIDGGAGLDLLASYEEFLGTLYRILLRRRSSLLNKQLGIFTTNFDIAFELALERLQLEHNDGFTGKIRPKFDLANFGSLRFKQSPYFENVSEIPTINLHKLHGSVNWIALDARGEIGFDRSLKRVRETSISLAGADGSLLEIDPDNLDAESLLAAASGNTASAEVNAFVANYTKLAIVNPTKEKFAATVLNETYYEQIRLFSNSLEKQNSVLLAHGFSFRDEHIRKIVLRAARSNPTLEVIVFCYSADSEQDYRKLIKTRDVKNGNITFVVPPAVDGDDAGYLLDVDSFVSRWLAPLVPAPEPRPDRVVDVNIRVDGAEHVES